MNLDDPEVRRVFFEVHHELPREGPGDRDCTARALELAKPLPAAPRILDIACGPGMQTLDLADLIPDARIVALDRHLPFLDELNRRARGRGVADRIETVEGDMHAPEFPAGSFDLIWCEGAAYIMGVDEALRVWRPLLAPGGKLALTEAIWLRPDPPERVRRCWAEYAAMGDLDHVRNLVVDAGYRLLGDFVLPERAWFEHYYDPMAARLVELAPKCAGDPGAQAVLDWCREEIEVYRAFAAYYGYAFVVAST